MGTFLGLELSQHLCCPVRMFWRGNFSINIKNCKTMERPPAVSLHFQFARYNTVFSHWNLFVNTNDFTVCLACIKLVATYSAPDCLLIGSRQPVAHGPHVTLANFYATHHMIWKLTTAKRTEMICCWGELWKSINIYTHNLITNVSKELKKIYISP